MLGPRDRDRDIACVAFKYVDIRSTRLRTLEPSREEKVRAWPYTQAAHRVVSAGPVYLQLCSCTAVQLYNRAVPRYSSLDSTMLRCIEVSV